MTIYDDGIKTFYEKEEIQTLLIIATRKAMFVDDPLEGRAYLLIKQLPDAKIGTVLRPAVDKECKLTEKPEYKNHYNYASKYAGRHTFIHREIIESEEDWFVRIN